MKSLTMVFFILCNTLFAQNTNREKTLRLLNLSGDENISTEISDLYISKKDFIVSDLSDENLEKMSYLLWDNFNDSIITQNILNKYETKFNQEFYDLCIKYFESEQFKRINQAETYSETPEAEAEMDAFAESAPITKSREKIINDFMIKTGIFSALWESAIVRPITVQLKAKKIILSSDKPSMTEIENYLSNYQKENLRNLQAYTFMNLLFTYREFSDEEIIDYGNFIQSEAGKWYHNCILEGSRMSYTKFLSN